MPQTLEATIPILDLGPNPAAEDNTFGVNQDHQAA